jgi:hypothetical protein
MKTARSHRHAAATFSTDEIVALAIRRRARQRRYRKIAPPPPTRECFACGLAFAMPRVGNQRHCPSCLARRRALKGCPECGATFLPRFPSQKFCGRFCQSKEASRRGKEVLRREQRLRERAP